jgi:uroporphyrinogen-III synthase
MLPNIYILGQKQLPNTISLPVFDIKYINQDINFDNYDALIFTSKNAVYAIDSININWKEKDAYCIANQTASVVQELGGNVKYISDSSYGDEFANELKNILYNKKVLFLSAKKIVSNLLDILKKSNIDIEQKVVYETILKTNISKDLQPHKNSIIIFSSPSTVEGFLNNFKWDKSYKAVAIGEVTAKHIPSYINFEISPNTSLLKCVEFARKLGAN